MTDHTPDFPTIEAMPTKELFIDMLTRDIALIPAIIDLVDNCADGAKNLRGNQSLDGLVVRISLSAEEFSITDNCGGITVDTARSYAFRFGRPPGAPSVKHSVGQFGVGMKRAIFKIGRQFRVESTTSTSHFVVNVDVDQWAKSPEWTFAFESLEDPVNQETESIGTSIRVTSINRDVAALFNLETFRSDLSGELKSRLQDPINKGLGIFVNGEPVSVEPLTMLDHAQLRPALKSLEYTGKGLKRVSVRLYCGLGSSANRAEAGWSVFCNGRLILEGDKSEVTGWGDEVDDTSIPGFHGQYNYFRGLAYFDSDDPSRLPWNTTKTGVNTDSPIYRAVKLEMMNLMRPVVDFLNRLKDEKQAKDDSTEVGPLEELVGSAIAVAVTEVATREVFAAPKVKAKPLGPKVQRIQYDVDLAQAQAVKRFMDANSWKEVGVATFQYFFTNEVEE